MHRKANGLAALFTSLLLVGCSSGTPNVTFQSDDHARSYTQQFTQSYFGQDANGNTNILLTEDGIMPTSPRTDGSIVACAAKPLRQIVRVRVLWAPQKGMKSDQPTATNATLDWYVIGTDNGQGEAWLHYKGAGFVTLSQSAATAKLSIRDASVTLVDHVGNLADPLGPSSVRGTFKALRNDAEVRAEIERFPGQTATAAAN